MITLDTVTLTPPSMRIEDIRELVRPDFERVNQLIQENLHTRVELIQEISQHIIQSGGKRLRPLLTLLSANLCHYHGTDHIKLAAIIEFIHTATLLHDDVVDASSLRRGHKTANDIWGNQASILVGDFLFSHAFQLTLTLQNLQILQVLTNTTHAITQGEMLQLTHRNNPDVSEAYYLEVIRHKTAMLFGTAAEFGAIIAECSTAERNAMFEYGLHLGMAFQMIDDWLDYSVPSMEMGKNIGDDLAEGKLTLPLIYAMQHGTEAEHNLIKEAIQLGGLENLSAIIKIIERTDAFTYIRKLCQKEIHLAKQALLPFATNPYKEALLTLADLALDRKF